MPKSDLDWTITILFLGYVGGCLILVPGLLMRSLQYFQDAGRISAVTKYTLAVFNLLVTLAALIYFVSYVFGIARKYGQETNLNSILFLVSGISALSLSIFIYGVLDKVLSDKKETA